MPPVPPVPAVFLKTVESTRPSSPRSGVSAPPTFAIPAPVAAVLLSTRTLLKVIVPWTFAIPPPEPPAPAWLVVTRMNASWATPLRLRMPPPSGVSACVAAPLRIVKWLSFALPLGVIRKPRYLKPPSMMFDRALAPTTVMSDWITRSLLMLIVPAGTLMVSGTSFVASEAASAVRRLTHVCRSGLQAGVVASLLPLVTVQVSACAGAATTSAASPAMRAARTRIMLRRP